MTPYRLRFCLSACAALTTSFVVGCSSEGPQRAAVQGTVTLDGTPLEAGVVRFIPAGDTKGPAAVATVQKGSYALLANEGPVVGTNRVEIEAIDHLGFALDDEQAFVKQVEKKRRGPPPNPIPARYHRKSNLTVEIKAESNPPFDFPLTAKPR